MKFSDKIQLYRKRLGYSQEQLAEKLEVSRQAVSKWETGQAYPELDKLVQLSDLFGVSVDNLVRDTNEEESPLPVLTEEPEIQPTAPEISQEEPETVAEPHKSPYWPARENNPADPTLIFPREVKKRKRRLDLGRLLAAILAIGLLLAIMTTVIVDFALNNRLTWSVIVASSCVLGGMVCLPPLIYRKKGVYMALILLTMGIMPYLLLIEKVSNQLIFADYKWAWRLGFPVFLITLGLVWIGILICRSKKLTAIWKSGIVVLLLCIGQTLIDTAVTRFNGGVLNQHPAFLWNGLVINPLTWIACLAIFGMSVVIVLYRRGSTKE